MQRGFDDERHLWPAFRRLIGECRPTTVLGEQVAGKAVDAWIDLVQSDMEAMGNAFGCIAFPSAGVGAPHIRDRIYWAAVAPDPDGARFSRSHEYAEFGAAEIALAWREFTRIHAEGGWGAWLSESGAGPLIDGAPARVGRTRAYGNAINAEAAKTWIETVMECI
jgi:DNA (cytosine-5)-methyltransferase 1